MNKEIEYLKDHLYEIYKYKKSKKDLTYDMDIEHLLRTCKALDYSQKEIERLNKKIEQYENPEDMTLMFMWCDEKAKDEIKRLNNIINELEKWLDKKEKLTFNSWNKGIHEVQRKLQELKGSDK